MNRKQYEIDNLPTQIVIGHQTETGVTSIYFDCTSWLASWPDLVLGVWATQPGGTAAYPAATHMEGDVLVWDVTDSDTAVPGVGTVEIVGITTGKKKLSAIAKTQIMRTTTGTTTTPPEGAKAWVDNVMQAASDAETSKTQAATYAEDAEASAKKAEENAKSVTWETLAGKPSAFPPETHGHAMSEVDGLPDALSQLKNDVQDKTRINYLRPTLQTQTIDGVTFTNDDGKIILNGTQTNSLIVTIGTVLLKANKTYKLIGCKDGAWGTYSLRLNSSAGTFIIGDIGEGNIYKPKTDEICTIMIYITSTSATFDNVVFKPMITTDLAATYDDFVSYDDSYVTGRDVIDKSSIGDEWASGKTYAVGDYCIRSNLLYKCKTAHTAGSAFSTYYWERTTVQSEIKQRMDFPVCAFDFDNTFGRNIVVANSSSSGTKPVGIEGNQYLVLSYNQGSGGFGMQLAIGFGSNKIAVRNKPYTSDFTSVWTDWRYI